MTTTRVEVTLQEAETGMIYKILVSEEEAKRLETDLTFATEKLMEILNAGKDDITGALAIEEQSINANSDTQNTDEAAQAFKWPHEAIMLLIEEYHVRESEFTSGKISQKKIWENISSSVMVNRGYHVTGPQCMSKFAGLKRTYKSVKDHNNKSGNGPRSWPYMTAMDDLLSKKPFMSPVATVSSSGKRSGTESDCSFSTINSDETTATTPKTTEFYTGATYPT